ncbi:GNAT family N-acetyltransferase [Bacteriovoracaceae bacterium]|nr:GNAT family N-acetyltransferase [Bacteriovoracaceae bacterium]
MGHSIRKALSKEAHFLSELALRSKAYWGYDKTFIEKCRPHIKIDDDYIKSWPVIVLLVTDKIVGFASLKVISDEKRLDNLWIAPEHIQSGYGTLLFNEAVIEAKKLGWDYFRLAGEEKSIGFYTKKGAKLIGKVQSRLGKDIFLPHMEYKIQ